MLIKVQLVIYVLMALQMSHFLPMLPVFRGLAEELLDLKAIGDVILCGAGSFFCRELAVHSLGFSAF